MRKAAQWRHGYCLDSEWSTLDRRRIETEGGEHVVVRLGRGEPLVLLPGLSGGWRLVMPLARRLARRNAVHIVGLTGDDTPTPRGGGMSVADEAMALIEVLDRLGMERPSLVGVSFGGAVALEMAAEAPGRIGSLCLYGAEARFGKVWAATLARRVLERFPVPSDSPFINQFFNLLHGGKPAPGPLPEFVVRRCWETDQSVMADRLRALESFDASDRLWRIDAPTLVVAGTRDVAVPADRQKALARKIGPGRFAAIEGAGHLGFLSHRREVAGRIARHLEPSRRPVA